MNFISRKLLRAGVGVAERGCMRVEMAWGWDRIVRGGLRLGSWKAEG